MSGWAADPVSVGPRRGGDHRSADRSVGRQLDAGTLPGESGVERHRRRTLRRDLDLLCADRCERAGRPEHADAHDRPCHAGVHELELPGARALGHAGNDEAPPRADRCRVPVDSGGVEPDAAEVPRHRGHPSGRRPNPHRHRPGLGDQRLQRDRTRVVRRHDQARAARHDDAAGAAEEAEVYLGLSVIGIAQHELGPIGRLGADPDEPLAGRRRRTRRCGQPGQLTGVGLREDRAAARGRHDPHGLQQQRRRRCRDLLPETLLVDASAADRRRRAGYR